MTKENVTVSSSCPERLDLIADNLRRSLKYAEGAFPCLVFLSSQKPSEIQLQGDPLFTGSYPGPQPVLALKGLDSPELADSPGRRGAAVRGA